MCGRFALSINAAQFERAFGVFPPAGYRERWNVAPDTEVVALRTGPGGEREAVLLRWGLMAPWMKDPKEPGRQINARGETAAEKPMFRDAFRRTRCVVPADGFYEWQKSPSGPSRPHFVRRRDGLPLAFAALWRTNRLTAGGLLETCAILTTDPYPMLRNLHHRMAVMLRPEHVDAWLDPAVTDPGFLRELLRDPLPEEELEAYEVGRGVSNVRNDGP
jgi:putative SOS response-associated peptidase YedK